MESHEILVVPGTTKLGREVCRLGRAGGHELTSFSSEGRPEIDEPWLAGVDWEKVDSGPLSPPRKRINKGARLVYLPGQPSPGDHEPSELIRLLDDASDQSAARIVYAATDRQSPAAGPTPSEQLVLQRADEFAAGTTVLQLPSIDPAAHPVEGPDLADNAAPVRSADHTETEAPDTCSAVPVGQAGMALLRAALQPETTGLVGCRAATRLGYAAMIR